MNAKVNISNRAGASFPVRRMDFEFAQVPRYWANYDAGLTHFMTALSALFPEGEQFFVNSTRAVRNDPKLADPALQKERVLLLAKKLCILKSILHLMLLRRRMDMMFVKWKNRQVKLLK